MKSFALFLNEINEGSTHAAITSDLAELLRTVQQIGKGGSLNIKIKVAPATRGSGIIDKVNITVDRVLALPKPEQPTDFFYLTDDGQTTRQHPRQQELALREVPSSKPTEFTQPDADGVIQYKEI